jgi:hypothetical protein
MARAWVELAEDVWGQTAAAKTALRGLGYAVAELRGSIVLLRVSVVELERAELLRVPGQG